MVAGATSYWSKLRRAPGQPWKRERICGLRVEYLPACASFLPACLVCDRSNAVLLTSFVYIGVLVCVCADTVVQCGRKKNSGASTSTVSVGKLGTKGRRQRLLSQSQFRTELFLQALRSLISDLSLIIVRRKVWKLPHHRVSKHRMSSTVKDSREPAGGGTASSSGVYRHDEIAPLLLIEEYLTQFFSCFTCTKKMHESSEFCVV